MWKWTGKDLKGNARGQIAYSHTVINYTVLYRVVISHHQHNYFYFFLSEELHGYMFRPISGHLRDNKRQKLKLKFSIRFCTLGWDLIPLVLQHTCQYKMLKRIKYKINNWITKQCRHCGGAIFYFPSWRLFGWVFSSLFFQRMQLVDYMQWGVHVGNYS